MLVRRAAGWAAAGKDRQGAGVPLTGLNLSWWQGIMQG